MPEIHKLVVKLGQKLHTPQDTWFQVFFLGDDDHMVDVVETQDINFEEVVACVKLGGSVFITYKKDI